VLIRKLNIQKISAYKMLLKFEKKQCWYIYC